MISWINLDSPSVLEEAVAASYTRDVVIFKHSTACSISHMAKLRLDSGWDLEGVLPYYLDLKTYRSLSQAVSERFNVHHESPQILMLKNGECVYAVSYTHLFNIELQKFKNI